MLSTSKQRRNWLPYAKPALAAPTKQAYNSRQLRSLVGHAAGAAALETSMYTKVCLPLDSQAGHS